MQHCLRYGCLRGCRKIWLPPYRGIRSNCSMDLPGGAECSLALASRAREFLQPPFLPQNMDVA